MTEGISVHISLLPPPAVNLQLIEASRQLETGGGFVLNKTDHIPHLSLYLGAVVPEKEPQLRDALQALVAKMQPIRLKATDCYAHGESTAYEGYAGIRYQLSARLKQVHERIVSVVNDFRGDAIRPKDRIRWEQNLLSSDEQESLVRYGARNAAERFVPHVTLSKVQDLSIDLSDRLPQDLASFSWTASAMAFKTSTGNGGTLSLDEMEQWTLGNTYRHD